VDELFRLGDYPIATEEDATSEEEVMEFMSKVGHPALEMDPMM